MDKMDRHAALRQLAAGRLSRMSASTMEDHLFAHPHDAATGEPLPYGTVYAPTCRTFWFALRRTRPSWAYPTASWERIWRSLCRPIKVVGEEPALLACPCCSHLTLEARGDYAVCPVCDWEDDGRDDERSFSSVNHGGILSRRADNAEQILMRGARYRSALATG